MDENTQKNVQIKTDALMSRYMKKQKTAVKMYGTSVVHLRKSIIGGRVDQQNSIIERPITVTLENVLIGKRYATEIRIVKMDQMKHMDAIMIEVRVCKCLSYFRFIKIFMSVPASNIIFQNVGISYCHKP